MLFNSLIFPIFLILSFGIYWFLVNRNLRLQNAFLLVASYIFYGWWDWRFLGLIFFSSVVDYVVGLRLSQTEKQNSRKILLIISLITNLGILGFFKYFNFFIDSFADVIRMLGMNPNIPALHIILPVGISFYTFQTLSYTIDIYRKKIEPTKDVVAFFAFVSFFPQLVAGPIERASALLPQFLVKRKFEIDKARDGLRQMLWGYLKKIVIADNLASHIDVIFTNYQTLDGITLYIGVFFFALQIYCDFSGYSDIAIGTARLFGFSLMRNFAYPYFSRDIAEFWRRWHISLSSWFRDYVYIPLGGSYVGRWRRTFNIIVTFTVSGLWHGANWTFVIWGLVNGLYYIPIMLRDKQKRFSKTIAENSFFPSLSDFFSLILTFHLALLAWVFFRASSLTHAFNYIGHMFQVPYQGLDYSPYYQNILFSVLLLVAEWFQRKKQHGLQIEELPVFLRWGIYYGIILVILLFGNFGSQQFIYFQF